MAQPRDEPQTEQEARELRQYLEQGAATSLAVERRFSAIRLPDSLVEAVSVPFDVAGEDLLAELTTEEDQVLLDLEITGLSNFNEPPLLVFVNRPASGREALATDPGFVGALAFFMPHAATHGEAARFRLNATQAVRDAAATPTPLTVTFVPITPPETRVDGASRVAKAEIQLVRSSIEPPS